MLSKPDLPHVTIAVVGGHQVGKTTFITSALDMRHPATSRTTTKKMSLDGSVYLVRLLEISSKEIVLDTKGPLWPRFGSDPSPPMIDGVLVLHDTTQPAVFPETVNLLGVCVCVCVYDAKYRGSSPLFDPTTKLLVRWTVAN